MEDQAFNNVGECNVRDVNDDRTCRITGLDYFPNGRLCLCDRSNKSCKLLDENNQLLSRIGFEKTPRDVAVISDSKFVVTIPEEEMLQFVSVTREGELKLEEQMKIGKMCWGVAVSGDQIYITCVDWFARKHGEVIAMSLDGSNQRRIGPACYSMPRYVAASNQGNVYVSDCGTNAVTSLKGTGEERYSYTRRSLLGPRGLSVHDDDVVFVCCQFSKNVHVITADGEEVKTSFTDMDELKEPLTMAYGAKNNMVAVTVADRDIIHIFRLQSAVPRDATRNDVTSNSRDDSPDDNYDVERADDVPQRSVVSGHFEDIADLRIYKDKLLSNGHASTVYQGTLEEKIPVAIKKIYILGNTNPDDIKEHMRILREVENVRMLPEHNHPNIVRFFKSEMRPDFLYLAFELCQGTLEDYVEEGSNWSKVLPWKCVLRQMTSGLSFLHDTVNLAHRDLKPSNVLLVQCQACNKAVLGDFSQSKLLDNSKCSISGHPGTLGWIAKEVVENQMDGLPYHKQSDIFALGCLFHYVATDGKHPFGNGSPMMQQHNILNGDFDFDSIPIHLLCLKELITEMIGFVLEHRPLARTIVKHPSLFDDDVIIKFFHRASNLLNNYRSARQTILDDSAIIPGGNWMALLPVHTRTHLSAFTLPNHSRPMFQGKETSVRFLLRAVRNCSEHDQHLPAGVLAEMGTSTSDHATFWLTHFPWLLMHVYTRMKGDRELMECVSE